MNTGQRHKDVPYSKIILVILFVIVQSYCWHKFGVNQHFDSSNYLQYSQNIIQHFSLSEEHLFWYTSYALFLAFFQLFNLSLKWVVITQVLISAIATCALYKFTLRVSEQKWSAFLASFLFIICIKIQWWNNYILTESLFINTNILFFYCLTKYKHFSWKIFRLLPFLIFIFFIRPTGLITAVSFTFFVLYLIGKNRVKLRWIYSFVFISGIITVILTNTMLADYNVVEPLQNGQIICGIAETSLSTNTPQIRLEYQSKLLRFAFFIWDNPLYFLKISFYKNFYFWTTYRTNYSFQHNLFSIVFFCPIYLFALFACWKSKMSAAIKTYILTFIVCTFILVMVTCVNWNSRFLAPALPFIFILAGLGIGNFISTFLPKKS